MKNEAIPRALLSGLSESDPIALDDLTMAVVITVPRYCPKDIFIFPDDDCYIRVTTFASYNGGQSWWETGGFGAYGGQHVRRDGTVAEESKMLVRMPFGRDRLFRVEIETSKLQRVACEMEEIFTPDTGSLMLAVAFDNAGSTSSAANVSSLTTAAFTIAGSDRLLMGGIMSGAGSPVDPTAMKWGGSGGTDLTKRGSTVNVGSFGKVSQYSLVAPTAASQTLYGSWPSNQDETAIGGVSYTGVDQTTPHGTQSTANAASSSGAATVNVTSAAGEVVSDVVMFLDQGGNITALTVGSGQVARVDIDNVGGTDFEAFGMSEEAGAGTVTMSWTISSITGAWDWGILGIPIKPAAEADVLIGQILI